MISFGKYTLLRKIGSGGMAEVFLAKAVGAEGLEKILVIKKILPAYAKNRQFVSMFVDEAKVSVSLNHPNIVQVYEFGQVGGAYYLAMEFVDGVDLGRLQHAMRRVGRTARGEAIYIAGELCKGLGYAHRKRDMMGSPIELVHRDVSPQNLLISLDGAVRIVDFGIAKARGVAEDENVVRGKFAYMAPEQAAGRKVDARSDLFAVGVMLYEMLLGRTAYGVPPPAVTAQMVVEGGIPRPRAVDPTLPEELERILLAALEPDARNRYQDARAMAIDLTRVLYAGGEIHDSGTLAALVAEVIPREGDGTRHDGPAGPAGAGGAVALQHEHPPRSDPDARPHTTEMLSEDFGRPDAPPARPPDLPRRSSPAGAPSDAPTRRASGNSGTPFPADAPRARPGGAISPRPSGDRHAGGAATIQPFHRSPGGERRPVVAVCGVVRGVAEIARAHGAVRAAAVQNELRRVLGDIAYKAGAIVHRAGPDGFLLIVGLPLRTADDPLRAVRLAVDLVEATDALGGDPPLRLGVGLAAVQAVTRAAEQGRLRYELLEGGLDLAERFAVEAKPGDVLAGGAVYHAARRGWQFEDLDAVSPVAPEAPAPSSEDSGAHSGSGTGSHKYRLIGPKTRVQRRDETRREVAAITGREAELGTLRDAFIEALLRETARAVVLTGDPGIGKTMLCEAFLASLPEGEQSILRGTADGGAGERPFGVVGDALRDGLRFPDGASAAEGRIRLEEYVGRLFADVPEDERRYVLHSLGPLVGVDYPGGALEQLDAAQRLLRTSLSLRRVVERAAAAKPLIILLDDFHHADALSRELLLGFLREGIRSRVLLVVAARSGGNTAAWVSTASGEGARVLELDELSADARLRLATEVILSHFEGNGRRGASGSGAFASVGSATTAPAATGEGALVGSGEEKVFKSDGSSGPSGAGGAVVDSLAKLAVARAGGNPLFLVETARVLAERGAAEAPRVPATVEGVVASRLDELSPMERTALGWTAAVGGTSAPAELVAAAAGADLAALLPSLAARGLLLETGQGAHYAFRTAVVRDVAYRALAGDARRAAHRAILTVLERWTASGRPMNPIVRAHHAAAAGDAPRAAALFVTAAHDTARLGSPLDALKLYEKALGLHAPVDPARFDLHERMSDILRALGRNGERRLQIRAMRRLAEQLRKPGLAARAAMAAAMMYGDLGRTVSSQKALETALLAAREAQDRGIEAEAVRLSAELYRRLGDLRRGGLLARRALELIEEVAARSGTTPDSAARLARARALKTLGMTLRPAGDLTGALQAYEEALVIARAEGDRSLEAGLLNNVGVAAVAAGDLEAALGAYKRALAIDRELGDRRGSALKLSNIGELYGQLGDFHRALRYLRKGIGLQESMGDRSGLADALTGAARVHLRTNEVAEARACAERALEMAHQTARPTLAIEAQLALADALLAGDPHTRSGLPGAPGHDPARALELAATALEQARAGGQATVVARSLDTVSRAQTALGQLDAARTSARDAAQTAAQTASWEGVASIYFNHYRLAGGEPEGRESLRRAVQHVRDAVQKLQNAARRRAFLDLPPHPQIAAAYKAEFLS